MTSPGFSRGAIPMTGSVVRGWSFGMAAPPHDASRTARTTRSIRTSGQRVAEGLGREAVAAVLVMPEVRVHVLAGRTDRGEPLGPGRHRGGVVALTRPQAAVREVGGHADRLQRARRALALRVPE